MMPAEASNWLQFAGVLGKFSIEVRDNFTEN